MTEEPLTIFEVGCGDFSSLYTLSFWKNLKNKIHLFEPNQFYFHELEKRVCYHPNVTLHKEALYDYNGQVEMYLYGERSYIKGINSKFLQDKVSYYYDLPDYYLEVVDCKKIDFFDKGDINILNLYCEGAEFYCLKHLISRPEIIFLELQSENYVNPHKLEILMWMKNNHYNMADSFKGLKIFCNMRKPKLDLDKK